MPKPLGDVRVVSLEQYGAGPYGTVHLAELGAEIIKIEQPPDGDVGRAVPPYRVAGDSLFFQSFNHNKLSVGLDVAHPRGRAILEELVVKADAVFSNLRGDVPDKLRIRYDDLAHLNPGIVCCSLSGYGMTGPRAADPGFDYMIQGLAGWMSITGEPNGPPVKTGLSVVDFSTGLVAALATMVAIHAARRDGVGCDCDVSLFDTALSMLTYVGTWAGSTDYQPHRVVQSGHPTLIPFGNFPTEDGWIVAGGSKEKFWKRLAPAIGRAELADDPRFDTFDDRLRHRDMLIGLLNEAFLTRPTTQWLQILTAAGVPCAPVNTVSEALADKQATARDAVYRRHHERLGPVTYIRTPVRVGVEPQPIIEAPALGQHTVTVLRDLLGHTGDEIQDLLDTGVAFGPGAPAGHRR